MRQGLCRPGLLNAQHPDKQERQSRSKLDGVPSRAGKGEPRLSAIWSIAPNPTFNEGRVDGVAERLTNEQAVLCMHAVPTPHLGPLRRPQRKGPVRTWWISWLS